MASPSMFGLFLGGWEIVLILAVVLILFGAKHLPELARGLGEGFFQFRKELDQVAHDLGKSLGGIYGKPAAQALAPDNQVAELYDPGAFLKQDRARRARRRMRLRRWRRILALWRSVLKCFRARN